jgi:inositol-1,4,5-trisphosphate 5-phosphatase
MTLRGTSVCIVNSHLPAHDYLLAERIRAYNDAVMSQTIPVAETPKILYHDYVFWLGDLNFRLDNGVQAPVKPSKSAVSLKSGPSFEQVLEKVSGGTAKELLKGNDQLVRCMRTGQAFSELKESLPCFPPTYKFVPGTNRYDPV